MSPHSRKLRVLPLALYAGASLAISTVALATARPSPLVLTAYGSAPGGADLLAGRYGAAVQDLNARGAAALDPTAVSANSCVAYAMTQRLRAARVACATAVRTARTTSMRNTPWTESGRVSANRRLAAAYTDQAVLRWLSHDFNGARRDLAKAEALAPDAGFVARNKVALKLHPIQAQAHGS